MPDTREQPVPGASASGAGAGTTDPVVVGVDGSSRAALALDWAAGEAARRRAPLTVVEAWSTTGSPDTPLERNGTRRHALDAARRAVAAHPGLEVDTAFPEQLPAPALIDASRDAGLLVVGSRGLGGFRGLLLGSVGQHCVTNAACSVAVVRPVEYAAGRGLGEAPQRIVVGVDGSAGADRAADWTAAEARCSGARVEVVGSWIFPGTSGYVFTAGVGVPGAAGRAVDDARARIAAGWPGVLVQGETSPDPPAVTLTRESRQADLVVVGSRGLGAFRGVLLGSVSLYLATHGHCPVVVVKGPEDRGR